MSIAPVITKQILMEDKIAELIAAGGGTITLSTTPYAVELQNLENQYWRYHTPFGVPGDMIYVLEAYRVDKVCQTSQGYTVHIMYKDGEVIPHFGKVPMAVTAEGIYISASGSIPDIAIRLKLVIQDVQVVDGNWVFTVARIQDTAESVEE